ncbi:hypothetical protein [Nocardia anaemiae]|nr:hypothetical protein [Nocardia anaemiae]
MPTNTAPEHYSKQDIRDLIEYAVGYQVEISEAIAEPPRRR